jgi:hypothetical protein
VSGTWTACRTAAAEVSGNGRGKSAPVPQRQRGDRADPDTDRAHIAWPGSGPPVAAGPGACPAARRARCHVRDGYRRTATWCPADEGGGRPPVQGSDGRGHQHGHRVQPVRVCRTLAVQAATVPEAADGQSAGCSLLRTAARSNSPQLPLLFLKAGRAGGRLRRPSSAGDMPVTLPRSLVYTAADLLLHLCDCRSFSR